MPEWMPDSPEARRVVEALREAQQENERLRAWCDAHKAGETVPRTDYLAMCQDRDRLRAQRLADGRLHGQNMMAIARQRNEAIERADQAEAAMERLRAEVAELSETADRAAKSFLTAQGERDEARGVAATWAGKALAEHGPEIADAVLREREECATLCEVTGAHLEALGANTGYGDCHAAAIRARSK